jgi:type II restriction enzyme
VAKVDDAQRILKALGLPDKQQTTLAGHILLALGEVLPATPWSEARRRDIGIHAMIQFIGEYHGKRYAENSRESFRKNVLRPLEQARVVDKNRDDPSRATNSMHNKYCLSKEAQAVVCAFGTADFEDKARQFTTQHGTLLEAYLAAREHHQVPVGVPGGGTVVLSPGKHNDLEKAIIEVFGPRFAPGSRLLYLGDTRKKDIVLDKNALEALGIPCSVHDKFPDVILHHEENGWLFLGRGRDDAWANLAWPPGRAEADAQRMPLVAGVRHGIP